MLTDWRLLKCDNCTLMNRAGLAVSFRSGSTWFLRRLGDQLSGLGFSLFHYYVVHCLRSTWHTWRFGSWLYSHLRLIGCHYSGIFCILNVTIQWVQGALSLGVKRPGREAGHWPSSSAEVKEWVELYLHSPITPLWRGVQLKHKDNFTFTISGNGWNQTRDPLKIGVVGLRWLVV